MEAGERCARIVRSFIAFAREQPMQRGRVGVNSVITETMEMLAYGMQVNDIDAVLDLSGDLPDVWADAQQIRQVLVNLVSNAQHAAAQVGPPRRVTIRTRGLSQPARAVIEVIDNGPGIDRDDRERVLEPFFTTKAVGQGMGLGLSVCHAIVTAHQGSLRLDSEPRRGTRVCVELPAAEGAKGP